MVTHEVCSSLEKPFWILTNSKGDISIASCIPLRMEVTSVFVTLELSKELKTDLVANISIFNLPWSKLQNSLFSPSKRSDLAL